MFKSKLSALGKTLTAAAFLGASAASMAQHDVAFSSEVGQLGDAVVVTFTFTNTGGTDSALEARARISNMAPFSSVDATNLCSGSTADFTSCALNDTNRLVVTATNFNVADPLADFTGTVVFNIDPTYAGALPETVVLEWNAAADAGLTFTPTTSTDGAVEIVAGPPAVLEVTPPSINFGSGVSPTTLGPETVTIANTGAAGAPDLNVTALAFSGADAAQFSMVGGTCGATPFPVSAGASCTVDLELNVNAVATFNGSFDVTADIDTAAIPLTGEGTAGPVPNLAIVAGNGAFGVLDASQLPATELFTLENTGDAGSTVTPNAATVTGPDFSVSADNCVGVVLAAADTCTVEVTFNPPVDGIYGDALEVTSDANTVGENLSGERTSAPVLEEDPAFGPLDLGLGAGGTTQTTNGTVTNTGSASGTFSCLMGGADAAIFSTTPDPLAGTVAAGETLAFSVSCNIPPGAVDGTVYNASLTCSGDLAGTYELSCGVSNVPVIPVPTMQPWALALFALMMLIVGGFSIRFFRAS